ncbi:hypothetical protein PYH37_000087 [Sinorhizobium numidicum]|uniref:Uncharacterized protein n=1 Tax=Sinorhizobium numidicum TaxID=680248 RepID=A0ABY8CQ96_9HYPH|nr:hypothetical protein [Sinorhizobium numidicum]WEX74806.1 hypothetical protein PYH37_000087 [Sinorhizobium numidicum]WEX80799.1 hypothetical protein PYH38_000089 [Sinorhizobium numidicum]
MGEKRRKLYEALLEGAMQGHSDRNLYDFVLERCPKTSSKKLVRASLLALTDPDLKDRTILSTIYALAIKHRLDEARADEIDDDPRELAPSMSGKQTPSSGEDLSA